MLVFPGREPLQMKFRSAQLSRDVVHLIKGGKYDEAADRMLFSGIPVNEGYRMLANCPRALARFLLKSSRMKSISVAAKQILSHLYIETALFVASQSKGNDRLAAMKKVINFIRKNKNFLSERAVVQMVRQSGEAAIMNNVLLVFGNERQIINNILASGSAKKLESFILHVPIEQQRWVFMKLAESNIGKLTHILSAEEKPQMDAIFDAIVSLVLKAQTVNKALCTSLLNTFAGEDKRGKMLGPHYQLLFIFWALLKKKDKIEAFYKTKEFASMDKDFIVGYLVNKKMYEMAAQVCAHVKGRHVFAVRFALMESMELALDLLSGPLAKEPDARECWLEVLKLCSNEKTKPKDCDWGRLVYAADASAKVNLDDVFPLVPPDMPMDALHVALAGTVQRSSDDMKYNEDVRSSIEKRATKERKLMNTQKHQPLRITRDKITCYVCGRLATDSPFEVFPCGYAFHVTCYLNSNLPGDFSSRDAMTSSCPACGIVSLDILDKPFVDWEKDKDKLAKWRVPV